MEKSFIGKRISRLRMAKNLSQFALSRELGQSRNYINQIENNIACPSYDILFDICDYFEITPSEFFDEQVEYPLEYRKLIKELNKLSPDELEKVFDMVRMITQNKK